MTPTFPTAPTTRHPRIEVPVDTSPKEPAASIGEEKSALAMRFVDAHAGVVSATTVAQLTPMSTITLLRIITFWSLVERYQVVRDT